MSYTTNDDAFERVDGFGEEPPPYSSVSPGDEARKQQEKIGFQKDYLVSVPGILKVTQIVLSLLGFIATMVDYWPGSGFVSWVTVSAFLTTSILFVVHAFNVYRRLPGFWPLYELIYLVLYTLKYFISLLICIIGAARYSGVIFGLVMVIVAFGVYLMDTIMAYKRYKVAREELERQRETGEGGANRRTENFCIIF